MSSAKWRPFCLGLNVLTDNHASITIPMTTMTKLVPLQPYSISIQKRLRYVVAELAGTENWQPMI